MNRLWFLSLLHCIYSVQIGQIDKVEYRPIDSHFDVVNGSCHHCLCEALHGNGSTPYWAMNCFEAETRCELYRNYSQWYTMISNHLAKFFFYGSLPPLPTCSDRSPANNGTRLYGLSDVAWPFDSNVSDTANLYQTNGVNSPTFVSPGYAGYGSTLSLNGHRQYLEIEPPNMNFSYRSFTVEAWIYANDLSSTNYGILSQCTSTTRHHCLVLMIRQSALRMAFWDDDCHSNTSVLVNRWYHVAFVYDYPNTSKFVYLDGKPTCINASSAPYQGFGNATHIGLYNFFNSWISWNGSIDDLSISYRVKTASEIRDDATLVVYYSFDDASNAQHDSGPLKIDGIPGNDTLNVSEGRVNRCLSFPGGFSESFFQIRGLRRLGIQNYPYSISLWLKPFSAMNNVTIIHLSSNSDGTGWCMTLMGVSSEGQLVASMHLQNSLLTVTGIRLPIYAWTHVVNTFSPENGLRLYINGTLFGSANGTIHFASGLPMTLTLGSRLNGSHCALAGPFPYRGLLDEFRLYSRELEQDEVCTWANVGP